MELAVYNISGKKTDKKVKLNKSVFGIDPNNHAIYLDVKQYLANQRQGTHKSKERGEITGSTRKIKKQKGTGTARAGSIKNPLFRSGGRVFGPQPRDYGFKLNKKAKKVARASALTTMANSKNITIVEDFSFDSPKTKEYLKMLSNFEMNGKKNIISIKYAQ
jgi:large subunit ribosomal protein L4